MLPTTNLHAYSKADYCTTVQTIPLVCRNWGTDDNLGRWKEVSFLRQEYIPHGYDSIVKYSARNSGKYGWSNFSPNWEIFSTKTSI